jgi:hypothetical protein
MDDDFGRFGCAEVESWTVGGERFVVAVVGVFAVVVVCARSFQNPAARYFMALRGSPSHMSVVRVMVPFPFSGQSFLEVPWGDHVSEGVQKRLMP